MNDNLLMSALCPHPPIIVQEVGRSETKKVSSTISSMHELSKEIAELKPDTIVVVTPHSLFNPYNFSIYTDKNLSGNFSNFGAAEVVIEHDNDFALTESIMQKAKQSNLEMYKIPEHTKLDHGTCVPLYFIDKAGFKGEIVVMNYCALDINTHLKVGNVIKSAIDEHDKKVVFIASGDLSHRVIPTAPAGYDPSGKIFDEFIVTRVKEGNYDEIIEVDEILRERAGECAFNSLMTVFGVIGKTPKQNKVYSYEAPFGVGYLVATL